MARQVKGALFRDYVRMLKARDDVDWREHLQPQDLAYFGQRIDVEGWYPMDTFERFGLAILAVVSQGSLDLVRAWGSFSVEQLVGLHEQLLAPGDPRDTLMRFQVLRQSFFDFAAITVRELCDCEAHLGIDYGMSPKAEEAASYQAMGFFERLVELAGGLSVVATLSKQAWRGDGETVLSLTWRENDDQVSSTTRLGAL